MPGSLNVQDISDRVHRVSCSVRHEVSVHATEEMETCILPAGRFLLGLEQRILDASEKEALCSNG